MNIPLVGTCLEPVSHFIVFAAALIQAAASIGFAMICAPLLALIDPTLVPGPMLVALMSMACIMAHVGRSHVDFAEFRWLLPGLLVGSIAGALMVLAIDRDYLALLLGLCVLIGVAVTASGIHIKPNKRGLFGGGTVSGLMGVVAGIHGPPLALLYARATPEKSRATIACIFVLGCVMALSVLAIAGKFGVADFVRGLTFVPAAVCGVFLARYLRHWLSGAAVRSLMLSLCALSALTLIIQTVRGL